MKKTTNTENKLPKNIKSTVQPKQSVSIKKVTAKNVTNQSDSVKKVSNVSAVPAKQSGVVKKSQVKSKTEVKTIDTNTNENKKDETKINEIKPVEIKVDQIKSPDQKPMEVKPVENKSDVIKSDDNKSEESKLVENKSDQIKLDEAKTDEVKSTENKVDVSKSVNENENASKGENKVNPVDSQTDSKDVSNKNDAEEGLSIEKSVSKLDLDGEEQEKKTEQVVSTIPRKLLILYAGETGNSEDIARRASWQAERYHVDVRALPFDEYEIKQLVEEQLALLICSTVNEGDEPQQMRKFWRFIMKRGLPHNCLNKLQFATIALGDSSYRKFAVAGKKLNRRMTNLGARPLLSICLGDDQHDLGYDATVDPWLNEFWTKIDQLTQPPVDKMTGLRKSIINESQLPDKVFEIIFINNNDLNESNPNNLILNKQESDMKNISSGLSDALTASSSSYGSSAPSKSATSADVKSYSDFSPPNLDDLENDFNMLEKTRFTINDDFNKPILDKLHYNEKNPYWAKVLSNDRVTDESHWQESRLLRLQVPTKKMSFQPGDVLHVMPVNADSDVQQFLQLFNLTGDEMVKVRRCRSNIIGHCIYDDLNERPLTVRELISRYVCINARPKRSMFDLLWKVADRDLERNKLKEFASDSGAIELVDYCIKPRRTALEVLLDFECVSKCWPKNRLLDLLPSLQPRLYSIANWHGTHPDEVHLLYAVVEYKTRMKSARLGICTSYLRSLQTGSRLACFIREGQLRLPTDAKIPLIMIGTGTGVAPLRSLIEQRAENNVSNNFLFFGCRGRNLDMYFADEWTELNARGLLYYYTAFSRQATNPAHIHHRLWEQRQLLWHLLATNDAYVYIAGRAGAMPRDVRATLLRMLKDQGADQLPEDQAEVLLDRLEQKGRIQYECWS